MGPSGMEGPQDDSGTEQTSTFLRMTAVYKRESGFRGLTRAWNDKG